MSTERDNRLVTMETLLELMGVGCDETFGLLAGDFQKVREEFRNEIADLRAALDQLRADFEAEQAISGADNVRTIRGGRRGAA